MSITLFHGLLVASGTEFLINLLVVQILCLVSCDITEIGDQFGLHQSVTSLLIEHRRLYTSLLKNSIST